MPASPLCATVSTFPQWHGWDCECNLPGQWEQVPSRATQANTIPTRIFAELLASAFWLKHIQAKRDTAKSAMVDYGRPGRLACNPIPSPRSNRAGGVFGL